MLIFFFFHNSFTFFCHCIFLQFKKQDTANEQNDPSSSSSQKDRESSKSNSNNNNNNNNNNNFKGVEDIIWLSEIKTKNNSNKNNDENNDENNEENGEGKKGDDEDNDNVETQIPTLPEGTYERFLIHLFLISSFPFFIFHILFFFHFSLHLFLTVFISIFYLHTFFFFSLTSFSFYLGYEFVTESDLSQPESSSSLFLAVKIGNNPTFSSLKMVSILSTDIDTETTVNSLISTSFPLISISDFDFRIEPTEMGVNENLIYGFLLQKYVENPVSLREMENKNTKRKSLRESGRKNSGEEAGQGRDRGSGKSKKSSRVNSIDRSNNNNNNNNNNNENDGFDKDGNINSRDDFDNNQNQRRESWKQKNENDGSFDRDRDPELFLESSSRRASSMGSGSNSKASLRGTFIFVVII